jgi:glycosyltransferase involved in cell wall biosynthesis
MPAAGGRTELEPKRGEDAESSRSLRCEQTLMRFGMVTTFYPPFSYGGDATYVRSLSRSLVALGHEVEIIASTDAYFVRSRTAPEAATTDEDGITVHRLHHPAGLLAALVSHQTGEPAWYRPALESFFAERFDVLHFHNISLMGAPGVLAMGRAKARLLSLHDHWLVCPTHVFWKNRSRACDRRTCFTCSLRSGLPPQLWRYTSLRERHLAQVDRVFAPSRFTAEMHSKNGVTAPIDVLPLFSSIERPTEVHEVVANRLVYAGRVTALKGIGELVRVVAAMPDIELIVIGEGDMKAELVRTYGERPNIRFLGKLDQQSLARHYSQAAAVVVPSIVPETFGLSLVEASACGAPAIVAKGAGGSPQIVDATGGGLVYEGSEELAAAIRRITGDRGLRDRLGIFARAGYEANYTREKHLAAYLRHIDEIVQDRA